MAEEKTLERIRLENEIYEVLSKFFPQHETRGSNAHHRIQRIADDVGYAYDCWVEFNREKE